MKQFLKTKNKGNVIYFYEKNNYVINWFGNQMIDRWPSVGLKMLHSIIHKPEAKLL